MRQHPQVIADHRVGTGEVYVVHSNRRYWLGRGLVAAAFALACGATLRTSSGWMAVPGVLGLVMFGVFALYAARQLLRAGPRLALDGRGVVAADFGTGPIPWADIERVEAFGSGDAPFVAFHLRRVEPWLERMPAWSRLLARVHAASGMPLLSVSLIGADKDAADVSSRARRMWSAAAQQR